jgi:hypothetical protein
MLSFFCKQTGLDKSEKLRAVECFCDDLLSEPSTVICSGMSKKMMSEMLVPKRTVSRKQNHLQSF